MKTQTHTPAPAFRVHVTAFAWTDAQAKRIQAQVEQMFTGAEVEITQNPAAAPIPPAGVESQDPKIEKFTRALVEVARVPETKVVTALGALVEPGAAPTPAPQPAPFNVGQELRDVHTGAVVRVTEVKDGEFAWENMDPNAADNAKKGTCPFASAACYEISQTGDGGPAPTAAAAAGSPDLPSVASSKRPRSRPRPKSHGSKTPAHRHATK